MKESNWLTFLVNGLIAILIGLLLLFVPGATILTIAKYFGLLLLVAGIVLFLMAIRNIRTKQPYLLMISEGLAGIILGAIILVNTRQSLEVFVVMLGIWALVIGIIQIIFSIRMKDKIKNYKLLQINGLLTALLGILLLFNPFGTVLVLGYIVGILALAVGILLIYYSVILKSAG